MKSQTDIDNAYNSGYNKGKTDGKNEHDPMFGADDKVGTIGTINDGTYNVDWVIYTISGNTYQLFPMQNLTTHVMNSSDTNYGGYTESIMYGFIHNTVLPNLRKSGLNIVACDLVSKSVYNDICSKTGKTSATIAYGGYFWLTDPYSSNSFYLVTNNGSIIYDSYGASDSCGVRPLITVVK